MMNFLLVVVARSLYHLVCFFDDSFRQEFRTIRSSVFTKKIHNQKLVKFVLLAEDKRFFEHRGIDGKAIFRALYRNVFLRRLEGGSTIEQQYVRLITGHRDISLRRKMRECLLACELSASFPKESILSSYLLRYRFIGNLQGIDEFAHANNLNLATTDSLQLSLLAARLKYPFAHSGHPRLLRRARIILKLAALDGVSSLKESQIMLSYKSQ